MRRREFIFHPMTVLVVSILAAAIFALFIILLFEGNFRWFLLYYFVPVGIPFVAFLFVRLPLLSGHALFLVYSLLSSRTKVARLSAALVLLQVAYLKVFITHDTALIGGIIGGGLAGLLYRRVTPAKSQIQMGHGL